MGRTGHFDEQNGGCREAALRYGFKCLVLLAGAVLAEARSNRMLVGVLLIYIAAWAMALFVQEISITESRQGAIALMAAFLRWSLLFYLGLFAVNNIIRTVNDKMLLLYLSMPISRGVFIFGHFFGFALLGGILAVGASVLLMFYAEGQNVLAWGFSLFIESCLVAGFALLCSLGLFQVTAAFSLLMALYLLSRMMHMLILMAQSPLLQGDDTIAGQFSRVFLTVLDYLLPRLDRFTRADWLIYGDIPSGEMSFVFQQGIIYLFLLLMATYFDFIRREI